jgi:hypothetical protein
MRDQLARGREGPLDQELKMMLRRVWQPLDEQIQNESDVIAVDGSRAIRPFGTGAFLYVVRALALHGSQRFREIEVDSFISRCKKEEINTFIERTMELMEFKAALQAVESNEVKRGAFLLIDGSLYGRMMALPRDMPIEGRRATMLEYMESYSKLLKACRRRGVTLLGVSKDSRACFIRDYFLDQMMNEELRNLSSRVESRDIERLKSLLEESNGEGRSQTVFENLKAKYPLFLDRAATIFEEYLSARPDHQMILRFCDEPGYTCALCHRPPLNKIRQITPARRNPEAYVEQNFKGALKEAMDKESFIERAVKTLKDVVEFPAVISFHVLLDLRDTPLRIDTPSWSIDIDQSLFDVKRSELIDADLCDVINMLRSGYGGLRNYNIWLKKVDQEVRLRRDVVDELYCSMLERILGETLIHSRGYRRVKYP